MENNKPVFTSNNSVEVFKTKNDLFDYYGGALGDCNNVKRVDLRCSLSGTLRGREMSEEAHAQGCKK